MIVEKAYEAAHNSASNLVIIIIIIIIIISIIIIICFAGRSGDFFGICSKWPKS